MNEKFILNKLKTKAYLNGNCYFIDKYIVFSPYKVELPIIAFKHPKAVKGNYKTNPVVVVNLISNNLKFEINEGDKKLKSNNFELDLESVNIPERIVWGLKNKAHKKVKITTKQLDKVFFEWKGISLDFLPTVTAVYNKCRVCRTDKYKLAMYDRKDGNFSNECPYIISDIFYTFVSKMKANRMMIYLNDKNNAYNVKVGKFYFIQPENTCVNYPDNIDRIFGEEVYKLKISKKNINGLIEALKLWGESSNWDKNAIIKVHMDGDSLEWLFESSEKNLKGKFSMTIQELEGWCDVNNNINVEGDPKFELGRAFYLKNLFDLLNLFRDIETKFCWIGFTSSYPMIVSSHSSMTPKVMIKDRLLTITMSVKL